MDREPQIRRAAGYLSETISLRCGELADEILQRPAAGTPEWIAEHEQRDTPAGRDRRAE